MPPLNEVVNGLADNWRPRRTDLGRVDERHFVFSSSGAGINATVVKRCPQAFIDLLVNEGRVREVDNSDVARCEADK